MNPNATTPKPDYRFYATLLDSFQNYLDSDENWNAFYGSSENPTYTIEEYTEKCRQELIDRINRVPFDSELADKGTAFNEVVDCEIEGRGSDKVEIGKVFNQEYVLTGISANYNSREFVFPIEIVSEFANYFRGAVTQFFCTGILPTKYGLVQLYGYIDELMPESIHDVKTTKQYSAGKFRKHWQHLVYPYNLMQMGIDIRRFEYNVTDFRSTYTEMYMFDRVKDTARLMNHCERFIEFLMTYRDEITDKKIFNI